MRPVPRSTHPPGVMANSLQRTECSVSSSSSPVTTVPRQHLSPAEHLMHIPSCSVKTLRLESTSTGSPSFLSPSAGAGESDAWIVANAELTTLEWLAE